MGLEAPLITRIALDTSGALCSQSAMMHTMQQAIEKALNLKMDSWPVLRETSAEFVRLRSVVEIDSGKKDRPMEVVVNSRSDGPFRVETNEDGPACIYEIWLINWRGAPPWLNDRLARLSLHSPVLHTLDDMLPEHWDLFWHADAWDSTTFACKHRKTV